MLTKDELAKVPARRGAVYYHPTHAAWLLPLLERIITEQRSAFLSTLKIGLKCNTLAARVQQGWQFIIDHVDTPDKRYYLLRSRCKIKKVVDGLIIELHDSASDCVEMINSSNEVMDWDEVLENYIRSGEEMLKVERQIDDTDEISNKVASILGPSGNDYQWVVTSVGVRARKLT